MIERILDIVGTAGIGLFYPLARLNHMTTAYEVLLVGTVAFALLGHRLKVRGLMLANTWACGWLVWILWGCYNG